MAGRIIDLSRADVVLPDAVLLDTSVIVPAFLPMLRRTGSARQAANASAVAFLNEVRTQSVAALVATASLAELAHLIVRRCYTRDLPHDPTPVTGKPFPNWTGLDKAQPVLARRYAADIKRLQMALAVAGVRGLQSAVFDPIPSGRRDEEELIRLMRRHRLDSGDAAILIGASRAGMRRLSQRIPTVAAPAATSTSPPGPRPPGEAAAIGDRSRRGRGVEDQ